MGNESTYDPTTGRYTQRPVPGGESGTSWTPADAVSMAIDFWTPGADGTWSAAAGVISQTDATADSRLRYDTPIPSVAWVLEVDFRIPTGQDAGTFPQAIATVGELDLVASDGSAHLVGEGVCLLSEGMGDGQTLDLGVWVDGNNTTKATAIAQGAWHTVRGVLTPTRQVVYLDGVYFTAQEAVTGGNTNTDNPPHSLQLGATGKVDFRNISVWTFGLPV